MEREFHSLRSTLQGTDRVAVRSTHRQLDEDLASFGGTRSTVVPFVAAFVIYLREGVEAALLVGALLAGLRKLGRSDARRYIHAGWIAALPAGVATWCVADRACSPSPCGSASCWKR